MKLSNLKHVLPELSALTGLVLLDTFEVLDSTVDDNDFSLECDTLETGMVKVEDWGFSEEAMDVELELTFVVVVE